MMEVISSKIKEFEEPITNKEIKRIYYEVIFLKNDLKYSKPLGRITLEKGLEKLADGVSRSGNNSCERF